MEYEIGLASRAFIEKIGKSRKGIISVSLSAPVLSIKVPEHIPNARFVHFTRVRLEAPGDEVPEEFRIQYVDYQAKGGKGEGELLAKVKCLGGEVADFQNINRLLEEQDNHGLSAEWFTLEDDVPWEEGE